MYLARYATAAVAVVSLTLGLLSSVNAASVPKTNLLSQWDNGSDAAAIAKLGEDVTAAGGKWQSTSIAGHTANTLAKLRADVAGRQSTARGAVEGPRDRGVECHRHDAEVLTRSPSRKIGMELVAPELLSGDEAKGFLGRGTDEYSPHQLDVGEHEGV